MTSPFSSRAIVSLCTVCSRHPRFAALTRCRSCLRSQTEGDLEAQWVHRAQCAARSDADSPIDARASPIERDGTPDAAIVPLGNTMDQMGRGTQ